jgi:hypothetical protein
MTTARVLLIALLLAGPAWAQSTSGPPARIKAAMAELWRRGTCLLSSVHKPAARYAPVPRDVGDTPVLLPRTWERRGTLLCYAAAGRTLWAADDECLYQVDAKAGTLVRSFTLADGLPDAPIQSMAAAGDALWLAARGGLARLETSTGRITAVPGCRFRLGRLAAGDSGAWLFSDAGAWRLAPGASQWRRLPDPPVQAQLARVVGRGFWWNWWQRRLGALIPAVLADADGLYVVCLKRLLRYDPTADAWKQICLNAADAMVHGRAVWALVTGGVVRHDPKTGRTETFKSGEGPAAGRPVSMAAAPGAFYLLSQPDYDRNQKRFVGGGVSRLDLATGGWTVTEQVDGEDCRFGTAILADGGQVFVACTLYNGAQQLGAHPGMAHVKRWRPRHSALGLLTFADGRWTLARRSIPWTDSRWVMGQKGTVKKDLIGPVQVDALCRCGDRLWGMYRMFPKRYYSGYYVSAGCLAAADGDRWQDRFDVRTDQLQLAGEQPELMLISHSHGHRIVLAEGHPIVLGLERLAGRAWAICQSGLFVHDEAADRFVPVTAGAFRFYWRLAAAAAGPEAVWLGGDGGSVSRLDRRTGRIELCGVAPGRKVTALALRDGRVLVRTAKAKLVLPVQLKDATKLPDADTLAFDGRNWAATSEPVKPAGSRLRFQRRGNYLLRGEQRVAFIKGIFKPAVLCEDPAGKRLWLAAYNGLAAVPLPTRPAD